LNAFAAAIKALGGEYLPNETTIRWYGQFLNDWRTSNGIDPRAAVNRIDAKRFGTSDAGIARFPGSNYDLGLLKNADGSYTPYFDSYGTGHRLAEALGGMDCKKLKMEYSAAVSTRMLARQGWRVNRTVAKNGAIELVASK
jgi:hypothetical protein